MVPPFLPFGFNFIDIVSLIRKDNVPTSFLLYSKLQQGERFWFYFSTSLLKEPFTYYSSTSSSDSGVTSQFILSLGDSVARGDRKFCRERHYLPGYFVAARIVTASYTIDTSPIGYFVALDYFVALQ